jgi:hypothetical protein
MHEAFRKRIEALEEARKLQWQALAPIFKNAKPFAWTKSQVYQKRLKPCFADQ